VEPAASIANPKSIHASDFRIILVPCRNPSVHPQKYGETKGVIPLLRKATAEAAITWCDMLTPSRTHYGFRLPLSTGDVPFPARAGSRRPMDLKLRACSRGSKISTFRD
jgi:hypothetical protein